MQCHLCDRDVEPGRDWLCRDCAASLAESRPLFALADSPGESLPDLMLSSSLARAEGGFERPEGFAVSLDAGIGGSKEQRDLQRLLGELAMMSADSGSAGSVALLEEVERVARRPEVLLSAEGRELYQSLADAHAAARDAPGLIRVLGPEAERIAERRRELAKFASERSRSFPEELATLPRAGPAAAPAPSPVEVATPGATVAAPPASASPMATAATPSVGTPQIIVQVQSPPPQIIQMAPQFASPAAAPAAGELSATPLPRPPKRPAPASPPPADESDEE